MPRPGSESVLFITGFPSPYARRMIDHALAAEPESFLYMLVEPSRAAEGQAYLASMMAAQRDRIAVLEGSPTSMDLGLSGAEFRQLAREVDVIHHMVHTSDAGADRKAAEALNVTSAAETLEIARAAAALRCLVFHSTAGVSGERHGVVYEGDLDEGQAFRSPVAETRMRAERLVRKAMRDVPIAVVRPTTMVGPAGGGSATIGREPGDLERLEGIYLLILLLIATPPDITIPLPGHSGETPLHVVPIDYVIHASHAIGRHPTSPGRTFHIADPKPPSARRVVELVSRAGRKRAARGYVPSDLAKTLLRARGIESFVRSPRAFVEQLLLPVRYDTRNTDAALAGTGVECPPFESYVDELVASVEEHVRTRRERRGARGEAEIDDPLS